MQPCLLVSRIDRSPAVRAHLDTYYWVDPGDSSKDLCYRRPTSPDVAGMSNLWERFRDENPAAVNFRGREMLEYAVRGVKVAGLDDVAAEIPGCNTTAAARADERVTVTSTGWEFAKGVGPIDESTFRKYVTQFNADDLCKMLGTANDHCKCPHCKEMEARIVLTHRNAMLCKAGKIPDASAAAVEPEMRDYYVHGKEATPMIGFYANVLSSYDEQHTAALIEYRAHLQKDINLRAWLNGYKYFGRALRAVWNETKASVAEAAEGMAEAAGGMAAAADTVADTAFAPIIYFAHGDDAADKEVPRVPVTETGLLEKIPAHLGGHHDKITDVAKLILREPGSGSNDSDGALATNSTHCSVRASLYLYLCVCLYLSRVQRCWTKYGST